MASALRWEPVSLKAHFRLTTQRLGQLQAKLDSYGNITRKDIATLLQQGNVGLARAKAHKLIQEDAHGDLLEILEMEVSTLLEHFTELDANEAPTALLSEAIASIIYAAPHVQCRELDQIRSTLIQRFGPDFARSAMTNKENHVPPRVIRTLNIPPPTATHLNRYLLAVARNYGVNWVPDPERHDIVNVLSELLNSQVSQEIDLDRLRKLCVYGLPDEPSWLRPRIWKLFFGILPPKQSEWASEISKQRDCYYDLVKRLLEPYAFIDDAEEAEADALDEALMNIFKHISRIPREMFSHLDQAPEVFPENPLSANVKSDVKIDCAFALDERLKELRENDSDSESGPGDNEPTPGIAVSNYDEDDDDDDSDKESTEPKTLVESRIYSFGNAHPIHCSAFLRLLFIHASINPGKLSPHVPALLVPLYSALMQEVEPEELAHLEADTFWLFEAIVSEISELDEEEGGQKWMGAFDRTTAWADPELHSDLEVKGLQPAVPHYSYRWLAPLLTYTIPVPSIFLVWDAIFARSPREREDNFKLNFLVDVATAMLIALRKPLLSLGQPSSSSLWNDEGLAPELAVKELTAGGDAFLEGISMLQAYPLKSIQDAERIIQTANDLVHRRELEKRAAEVAQTQTWGATIRDTMWKGFTNQIDDAEDSPPGDSDKRDDGNETERPAGFGLASMLGGLRAKAPPAVPPKETAGEPTGATQPTGAAAGFWNYAGKLKDSDTVATLAKVGTNWRAKAASVGAWGRNNAPVGNIGQSSSISQRLSGGSDHAQSFGNGDRRDTFVNGQPNDYRDHSPRPYFTSPTSQDPSPGYYSSSSNSSSMSPSPVSPGDSRHNQESFVNKTKNLLSIGAKSPPPVISKPSPRPLLLNSGSSITSPPAHMRTGSERLKTPDSAEWSEVIKMKKQYMHRHSQSSASVSSLSPSEAMKSNRSDWDSDTGSRVVPLNRRSVSPMAPSYRTRQSRQSSITSEPYTPSHLAPARGTVSPTLQGPGHGARRSSLSPNQLLAPIPQVPPNSSHFAGAETANSPEPKQPGEDAPQRAFIAAQPEASTEEEEVSWRPTQVTRHPRVRSKKYPQRPANLQMRDTGYPKGRTSIEQKTPSPSNLTVDWPGDDTDLVTTPRATSFDGVLDGATPMRSVSPRLRHRQSSKDKPSRSPSDAQDARPRKLSSSSGRPRKTSTAGDRDPKKNRRQSAADEGDDEGYDDLLSAYESEDDPRSAGRA